MHCPACAETIADNLPACPLCRTPLREATVAPAAMPPAGVIFVGGASILGVLSVMGMSQVNGGAVLVGLACLCGIFARIIQVGAQHKAQMAQRRPR